MPGVERTCGEDRQLPGRVESRWQEVRFVELVEEQLEPGRDDRAEESRRSQGRQGNGEEVLIVWLFSRMGIRPRRQQLHRATRRTTCVTRRRRASTSQTNGRDGRADRGARLAHKTAETDKEAVRRR